MAGANVFVMYADGAGNVTVSARKSTGRSEPKHQTDTKLTLLEGSGITDNGQTMLANIRCANCESWDGGSLSLSSTSSPFISAWKEGSPLNTKNLEATIARHDSHDQFAFDLTRASIGDDQNPFVNNNNGGSPSLPGGSNNDSSPLPESGEIREIAKLTSAHGIVMSIVMVALYPLGSILMPLFGNWSLHATWQTLSFIAMWAGFGIGVVLAQRTGYNFIEAHTKLGTAVVALFGIQPIGGYLHHRHYLKYHKRGLVSYGHIWYGRILMVLGIINGGLGLKLSNASKSLVTAYAAIAAIIFIAYIGGAFFAEVKRRKRTELGDNGPKESGQGA